MKLMCGGHQFRAGAHMDEQTGYSLSIIRNPRFRQPPIAQCRCCIHTDSEPDQCRQSISRGRTNRQPDRLIVSSIGLNLRFRLGLIAFLSRLYPFLNSLIQAEIEDVRGGDRHVLVPRDQRAITLHTLVSRDATIDVLQHFFGVFFMVSPFFRCKK